MEKKRILFVCGVFYPEPVVSARLQTDLAIKLSENFHVTVLRPRPTRPKGFTFPHYDYSVIFTFSDHFNNDICLPKIRYSAI